MENRVDNMQTEIARYQTHLNNEKELYGHCREIVRSNARFLLRSNFSSLLNGLNSTEIGLGQQNIGDKKYDYYKLVDFVMFEPQGTLDLTWMQPNDVFGFGSIPQYRSLKTLAVNIDNLAGSYLPSSRLRVNIINNEHLEKFEKKNFIIHGENSELSSIQQIKAFNTLLDFNHKDINSISLEGFNSILNKIFTTSGKMRGIPVSAQNEMVKTNSDLTR